MIDWGILNWIHNNLSCSFLDFLMPKITILGDMGAIWVITALVLICIKKYRRYGVILFAGLLAGLLVGNGILKHLFARSRPCWLNTDIPLLIANPTDYSFPSGHTLSSVISATILFLTNRWFGRIAIPLAALIAFSRLYLYVHFPSDILGGLFLGIFIGMAVFFFESKIHKRFQRPETNYSGQKVNPPS